MRKLNLIGRAGAALLAVLTLGALIAPIAGAANSSLPGLPTGMGNPTAKSAPKPKPKTIIFTGDGSGFFAGDNTQGAHPQAGPIVWTSWTASTAQGTGALWINNCTPNCAAGKFSAYKVTLSLTAPRTLGDYDVFTKMRVAFTGAKPKGEHDYVMTLIYLKGSGFSWKFPIT